MEPAPRYEIVDTIASGDFATVYRARDRELGREVAVKQIHQQFLSDERQLARYWQEAQLLATLQHPNILTIYDIVRPRGWLILELMQGNLQKAAESGPMDLDRLRVALAGCLSALQFLHANGVIHGDVKPSNMLVDVQNRVKLGDFGLARRASNEEGSLLKGTTKYMAPELVSQEFGPVGPASDLYSLGFSAYELICGPQFESLFPGLSSFGRDKQIAWMMWHAAADRNLPEIGRVLEGVPEDLARVVQKLIVKDQSRRYQSAQDVLADLQFDPLLVDRKREQEAAEAEAVRAAEAKKKRRRRFAAVLAVAFSAMICVALLLPKRKPPAPTGPPEPVQGVITNVYPDEWKFAIVSAADDSAEEISLKRHDQIFINDKSQLLRDLRPDDRVTVKEVRDQSKRKIKQVYAYRPEIHKGRIIGLEVDEGQFALAIEEGDDQGEDLLVSVPTDLQIVFNGEKELSGKPVRLADLQSDDRVTVHHIGEETGRVATALSVLRVVSAEGVFSKIDGKTGNIVVALGEASGSQKLDLPSATGCEVTVNDLRSMKGQLLEPKDLRPGDKVTVFHDTRVVRVNAYRVLGTAGVIRKVQYSAGTLAVVQEGADQPTTYIIRSECKITLGGQPVELADLRDGDTVDITHDSPDVRNPEAIAVAARRPADSNRWAILIGMQNYEDLSLSRLSHTIADVQLVRDALVARYRVPADQAMLLTDESLVRLEQGIPERLGRIGAGGKAIVYYAGHAYRSDEGKVYLAPKNFDFRRMDTTGLPLQWLVDQFEQCPAGEKLLLLDCTHAGRGADLAEQPSTAEMISTLRAPPGRAPLRTVTAVASCRAGQRGLMIGEKEKRHGLFAWLLAEGYSGQADKNRDNQLEPTELFAFLDTAMAEAASRVGGVQTPQLFLPDARPPRLSADAQKAIRRLAAFLRQDKVNVDSASEQYDAASQLAGKELEPKLLYGLLLIKAKQRDQAIQFFEDLKIEHPDLMLPLQGRAWLRFEQRKYKSGVADLRELVSAITQPAKPTDPFPEGAQRLFYFAGQLREFSCTAVQEAWRPLPRSLAGLDAAVAEHGDRAVRWYEQGRSKSRAVAVDFDRQIADAEADATAAKLKVERRRLVHYVTFPFDSTAQQILAGLDQ